MAKALKILAVRQEINIILMIIRTEYIVSWVLILEKILEVHYHHLTLVLFLKLETHKSLAEWIIYITLDTIGVHGNHGQKYNPIK